MLVAVGSVNPVKVSAVEKILLLYEHFAKAIFYPIEVSSGVIEI